MVFYGQLASGTHRQWVPLKMYKDSVKAHVKMCNLSAESLTPTGQSGDNYAT